MDFSQLPLGKKPFVAKSKDLKLANYIDKSAVISAAQVPLALDWQAFRCANDEIPPLDTDPLGNDRAGNCVFAGPGHQTNMIRAQQGIGEKVTKEQVIAAYAKYSGYDPVTGANDDGFVVRDMLKIWQRDGLYGCRALAYALVNWHDPDEVAVASWLGCGTIGGYSLPKESQDQHGEDGKQLWYVPQGGWPSGRGPGTWGGHCIWVRGTSPKLSTGNSWGQTTLWDLDWQKQCCDEMWLVITDEWATCSPNGFSYQDLLNDVKARTA